MESGDFPLGDTNMNYERVESLGGSSATINNSTTTNNNISRNSNNDSTQLGVQDSLQGSYYPPPPPPVLPGGVGTAQANGPRGSHMGSSMIGRHLSIGRGGSNVTLVEEGDSEAETRRRAVDSDGKEEPPTDEHNTDGPPLSLDAQDRRLSLDEVMEGDDRCAEESPLSGDSNYTISPARILRRRQKEEGKEEKSADSETTTTTAPGAEEATNPFGIPLTSSIKGPGARTSSTVGGSRARDGKAVSFGANFTSMYQPGSPLLRERNPSALMSSSTLSRSTSYYAGASSFAERREAALRRRHQQYVEDRKSKLERSSRRDSRALLSAQEAEALEQVGGEQSKAAILSAEWQHVVLTAIVFQRAFQPWGERSLALEKLSESFYPQCLLALRRLRRRKLREQMMECGRLTKPSLDEFKNSSPVIDKLPENILKKLHDKLRPEYYHEGETLLHFGESPRASDVVFIVEGLVQKYDAPNSPRTSRVSSSQSSRAAYGGGGRRQSVGSTQSTGNSSNPFGGGGAFLSAPHLGGGATAQGSQQRGRQRQGSIFQQRRSSSIFGAIGEPDDGVFPRGRTVGDFAALIGEPSREAFRCKFGHVLAYSIKAEDFREIVKSAPVSAISDSISIVKAMCRNRLNSSAKPSVSRMKLSHPFFAHWPDEALYILIESSTPLVARDGEKICRDVRSSSKNYFIVSGEVCLLDSTGKPIVHILPGQSVGTDSICYYRPPPLEGEISLSSRSFSEIWTMNRADILSVMMRYQCFDKIHQAGIRSVSNFAPSLNIEVLKQIPVLGFITDKLAARVVDSLEVSVATPNTLLAREGIVISEAFVVISGVVQLTTTERVHGALQKRVVRDVLANQVFGLTELLAQAPSPYTANVPNSAIIRVINRNALIEAVDNKGQSTNLLLAILEKAQALVAEQTGDDVASPLAHTGSGEYSGLTVGGPTVGGSQPQSIINAQIMIKDAQLRAERRAKEWRAEERRLYGIKSSQQSARVRRETIARDEAHLKKSRQLQLLGVEQRVFAALNRQLHKSDTVPDSYEAKKQAYYSKPIDERQPAYLADDSSPGVGGGRYKWSSTEADPTDFKSPGFQGVSDEDGRREKRTALDSTPLAEQLARQLNQDGTIPEGGGEDDDPLTLRDGKKIHLYIAGEEVAEPSSEGDIGYHDGSASEDQEDDDDDDDEPVVSEEQKEAHLKEKERQRRLTIDGLLAPDDPLAGLLEEIRQKDTLKPPTTADSRGSSRGSSRRSSTTIYSDQPPEVEDSAKKSSTGDQSPELSALASPHTPSVPRQERESRRKKRKTQPRDPQKAFFSLDAEGNLMLATDRDLVKKKLDMDAVYVKPKEEEAPPNIMASPELSKYPTVKTPLKELEELKRVRALTGESPDRLAGARTTSRSAASVTAPVVRKTPKEEKDFLPTLEDLQEMVPHVGSGHPFTGRANINPTTSLGAVLKKKSQFRVADSDNDELFFLKTKRLKEVIPPASPKFQREKGIPSSTITETKQQRDMRETKLRISNWQKKAEQTLQWTDSISPNQLAQATRDKYGTFNLQREGIIPIPKGPPSNPPSGSQSARRPAGTTTGALSSQDQGIPQTARSEDLGTADGRFLNKTEQARLRHYQSYHRPTPRGAEVPGMVSPGPGLPSKHGFPLTSGGGGPATEEEEVDPGFLPRLPQATSRGRSPPRGVGQQPGDEKSSTAIHIGVKSLGGGGKKRMMTNTAPR